MTIPKEDIIGKIRKAIDDIVPDGFDDSFVDDADEELWQAVYHASIELSAELPVGLLDATVENLQGSVDTSRGYAYRTAPDDFLRFVNIDITGAAGILTELIEQGSDAEKMQRSPWSRGTASKPKAMIGYDDEGQKTIYWWPGNTTATLTFIAIPELAENAAPHIICAIRPEAEKEIIYRAASIFFEGKKEGEIAEKFRNL